MSDIKTKIITWKKADQRLCTIAAAMLNDAMDMRISPIKWEAEYGAGSGIFLQDEVPLTPSDTRRTTYPPGIWQDNGNDTIWAAGYLAPQCFYSISNIIRLRLKHARLMLYRNLFGTGNVPRQSGQRSRNPNGR